MSTFYVGTRKAGATSYRVSLDPMVPGWAEDIATVLRGTGAYADVRVFPTAAVDRLVDSGAVQVSTT